jgi:microcin C transport system substrate-binding protein
VQEKQHDIQFTALSVSAEMYPRYWESFHSVNAFDRAFGADGKPNPARKPKTNTNNMLCIAIPELDKLIESYRASGDAKEMKRMAFAMEKIIHEDASFVPGYVTPFYRVGYWRWLKWPDGFNAKLTDTSNELWLSWIDPEVQQEVEAARKAGTNLAPIIGKHDQYRDR